MAIILIRNSFLSVPRTTRSDAVSFQKNWQEALGIGIHIGPQAAPVTIVEFADLECPVCAALHLNTLQPILREFANDVAFVHVHFPLDFHRFAMPAARGAECAAAVGRLSQWLDIVYGSQDSLGLKSWGRIAHEAGIDDTTSVATCAASRDPVPERILAGIAMGERLRVNGTPTLFINGWRLNYAPNVDELRRIIRALLENRVPFPKQT